MTRIGGADEGVVGSLVGCKFLETKLLKCDCLPEGCTGEKWRLLIGVLSWIRMTGDLGRIKILVIRLTAANIDLMNVPR